MGKLKGSQLGLFSSAVPQSSLPYGTKVRFRLPTGDEVEGHTVEGMAMGPNGPVRCEPFGTLRIAYSMADGKGAGDIQLPSHKITVVRQAQ